MPVTTGISRETGLPLSDLDHVRQSARVIFTTALAQRVLRRTFGSAVPDVLGQNLVTPTLTRFWVAVILAIELWEPRLRVVRVLYPAPPNTPSTMRVGGLELAVLADYRPYALQGDTTTGVQRVFL